MGTDNVTVHLSITGYGVLIDDGAGAWFRGPKCSVLVDD